MPGAGKSLLLASLMIAAAIARSGAPALAGDQPKGVVELFTSQGCSSCPPADRVLGELVEQGDVIALGYHVDYWNYLGWKDTFSSKQSTDRQYAYARALGRSSVYTPQAVIDGRDHINGSDRTGINTMIDDFSANGRGLVVPVEAGMDRDRLQIHVGEGNGKADIVLVYFDDKNTVDVGRGENAGRKLTYWHSVRDIQTVGMWDGKALDITLPASVLRQDHYGGCAILLQSMKPGSVPGPILGAAMLMDKDSGS